ncbi:MAG: hypothetical protein ACRC1H_10620, partial [Caldilineaceae bacterium]
GLRIGILHAVRARPVNTLGMRGPWRQITHTVSGRRAPVVWRQASPPSGQNGDEWVDTDDGSRRYLREGGVWVAMPVGTGGLDTAAATEVVADAVESVTVSRDPPPGPGVFYPAYFDLVAISWTNSSAETRVAEVSVDAGALRTGGAANAWVGCNVGLEALPGTETDADRIAGFASINAGLQRRVLLRVLSVAPGQTVYARAVALIDVPAATTTVRGRECSARITVVKR